VDLKEEVERFARECGYSSAATIDFQFAKHFFELGVNASNPLTWKDMRIIDKISEEFINSEDYDKFDEEGYYKEVLKRFKAQKGEKV